MSRLETTAGIGARIIKTLAGLWFAAMGLIGSVMLYNELFDPEWGQANKQRFPEPPPWYIDLLIGLGAAFCFYVAFRLILGKAKHSANTTKKVS